MSKPRAMSCEFTCSQLSFLIAQDSIEKNKLPRKKPLPVLAVAMSKSRTINCEHTCSPR